MPFWVGLLIRFGVPLLLKLGVIDQAEALGIRAWFVFKKSVAKVGEVLENVETYSDPQKDFPTGVNGQSGRVPVSQGVPKGNWNKGGSHDDGEGSPEA